MSPNGARKKLTKYTRSCFVSDVESGSALNFFPHCEQKFADAEAAVWHDGQCISDVTSIKSLPILVRT